MALKQTGSSITAKIDFEVVGSPVGDHRHGVSGQTTAILKSKGNFGPASGCGRYPLVY